MDRSQDQPGKPSISAVLPAFNEEQVIVETVERTRAALHDAELPSWEVVVVNDGSVDSTAKLVSQLSHDDPAIRMVSHPHNRGYGAALKTGFDSATKDAVWLMDSDGQFDPSDLLLLLRHYGSKTAVFGFRENRQDTMMRRANHAAFFSLVRMVYGKTATDVNCAFKLFPAELGQGLHAEGAIISTELVLRARHRGYNVAEVGVPHYPRLVGKATGANPKVVMRAFAELLSMRREHWEDLAPGE